MHVGPKFEIALAMATDMDSFEKIFCGVWKHDRDENLVEALKKMGGSDDDIKKYAELKPTLLIERRGDSVYIDLQIVKGVSYENTFKFGEEFEAKDHLTNPPSFHNKQVATFSNGVITFKAKTQLTGPGKVDTHSDFVVKDGELHTLMSPLNDTSFNGNRIYKRN